MSSTETYIANLVPTPPAGLPPTDAAVATASEGGVHAFVSIRPDDTTDSRSHLAAMIEQPGGAPTTRFSIRSVGGDLVIYMGDASDGQPAMRLDAQGNLTIRGKLNQG